LVCVLALGASGCTGACGGLDLYQCVDDTACTPVFAPAYESCVDMSAGDCANHVERLPPEGREFFCMQVREWDGDVSYGYLAICAEDSDCPDGRVCFLLEPDAPWGECENACPENECTNDADCPKGYVCYWDVCGEGFVRLLGHGWDSEWARCIPTGTGGVGGDGGSATTTTTDQQPHRG